MKNDLLKQIGERIKENRKSQRITQEELSEMAEISPSFLGMIERGKSTPSIMTITKLCKALNLFVGSLFEEGLKSKKPKQKGDFISQRIINLLKNKTTKDKELALRILKKLFC